MRRPIVVYVCALVTLIMLFLLAGCGGSRLDEPTRTPVPTWTPTPGGGQPAAAPQGQSNNQAGGESSLAVIASPAQQNQSQGVAGATPVPPTETPTVTATPLPTEAPTETPIPTPTPTVVYQFELEAAEKFPSSQLAANVVRVYLYVYSETDFSLPGYSVRVVHNQTPLSVNAVSGEGLPQQTRAEPGPYTRFTNMDVLFTEPQAGTWEVTLVDETGAVVGPPAAFTLTADEETRELYLRYKRK